MKDFDENNEELKDASFLNSLKKENVFHIPKNYFVGFSEELEDKIDDEIVLSETPFLNEIPKKNVFHTPENYFESSFNQFQEKLNFELKSTGKQSKVINMWSKPQLSISIAAVITLLISIGIWIGSKDSFPKNNDPMAMLNEISTENILASVDVSDYDIDMLLEAIGDDLIDDYGDINELPISEEEASELLDQIDISDLEAEFIEITE